MSRRSRARCQLAQVTPFARADRHDVALLYPPTRKKSGMTWKTQVSPCSTVDVSRMFAWTTVPSRTTTAAMSQCPRTTTVIATAR